MTAYLCDRMLKGLSRWMRAAGHDTLLASSEIGDTAVISRARKERRTLVTCDKRMIREREELAVEVIVLNSNTSEKAGPELSRTATFDWLYAPFTRCMVDNAVLEDAGTEDLGRIPPSVTSAHPVRRCPECGRVYWRGSHADRIRRRLEHWQALRQ